MMNALFRDELVFQRDAIGEMLVNATGSPAKALLDRFLSYEHAIIGIYAAQLTQTIAELTPALDELRGVTTELEQLAADITKIDRVLSISATALDIVSTILAHL